MTVKSPESPDHDILSDAALEETFRRINKALAFYKTKLSDQKESKEAKNEDLLRSDIEAVIAEVDRTTSDLKIARDRGQFFDLLRKSHIKLSLCEALIAYATYFEDLKENLFQNLGVLPDLKRIDSDIEILTELRLRLCK
jgi:hypothetical protein